MPLFLRSVGWFIRLLLFRGTLAQATWLSVRRVHPPARSPEGRPVLSGEAFPPSRNPFFSQAQNQ